MAGQTKLVSNLAQRCELAYVIIILDDARAEVMIDHSIRIYLFDRSFDHRFSSIRS